MPPGRSHSALFFALASFVIFEVKRTNLVAAQCDPETNFCGDVRVDPYAPPPTAAGAPVHANAAPAAHPANAPAPAAAAQQATTSSGEDGFTGALTATFGDQPFLWGGMLTAHFGMLPWISVDVGLETASNFGDVLEARETGIHLGLRLIPNPRGRFRLVLPIRAGGLLHSEFDTARSVQSRRVQLTADAGAGFAMRILGPVYLSAILRAQVRRIPGADDHDLIGKADVGLTFLF